ncbi:MAG: hypothetical protein HY553_13160 [Elusimicrobia bacterium]|nr:hypothetical protein [Elusimicrobiota bacterium]
MVRVAAVAAILAAAVYADIAARAYSACLEGERYLEWHRRPDLQREHWDAWLKGRREAFEAERRRGALTEEELAWRLRLARAERDERVSESALKYAVRWFETASDLFSTPPSPWSRRARERLGPAREAWRAELAAKGIRLEDFPYR